MFLLLSFFPKSFIKGRQHEARCFYCVGVWLPLCNRLPNVLGYNVWHCTHSTQDFQTPFPASIIAFHSAKRFIPNYRPVCFLFCCLVGEHLGHLNLVIQGKEPMCVKMVLKVFVFSKNTAIDFKQCLL